MASWRDKDARKAYERVRTDERIERGLCRRCPNPLEDLSKTMCSSCLERGRLNAKASRLSRIAAGRCASCLQPVVEDAKGSKCAGCKGRNKKSHAKLKELIMNHYGSVCNCCGEHRIQFLTIDHINNDGAKHRKEIGLVVGCGIAFYRWIRRNNFPEDLQVLCHNCNIGKYINGGVCPHASESI